MDEMTQSTGVGLCKGSTSICYHLTTSISVGQCQKNIERFVLGKSTYNPEVN